MEQITLVSEQFTELEPELLESMLDLQKALHQATPRDVILHSRDYRRKQLLDPIPENRYMYHVFAVEANRIVGHGLARYYKAEVDTNPEGIWIYTEVHPDHQNRKIGSLLMAHLHDHATSLGRTKFESGFYPLDGDHIAHFLTKFGYVKKMEEKVSRLYRDKINWDYIDRVETKYQSTFDKYDFVKFSRQEWADRVLSDDNFAEAMADFYTEAINLLPWEDFDTNPVEETAEDMRKNARHIKETDTYETISYYAFDSGKIIGMSGSYYDKDFPIEEIGTGLTAVRKDYQRQGLATLLKIKILRLYLANFPDFRYIVTENAHSNEGMLSINTNLGFAPVFTWEMWQH